MRPSHTIRPVFDDPNLVSSAGLVPALRLAESAGFGEFLAGLSVPSPHAAAKAGCIVGGMLAGADSIDDLDLLRHGGMARLFGGPALAEKVQRHVSLEAWKLWKDHMMRVINEFRLDPTSDESNQVLAQQMEQFFFGQTPDIPNYIPTNER